VSCTGRLGTERRNDMKRIAILIASVAAATTLATSTPADAANFTFTGNNGVVGAHASVGFNCYTATKTATFRADYLQTDGEWFVARQEVFFRVWLERWNGIQWVPGGYVLDWHSINVGGWYDLPVARGTGHYRLFTQFAFRNAGSQSAFRYSGWLTSGFNKQDPLFVIESNYCTA
jgi:hypothetical protein